MMEWLACVRPESVPTSLAMPRLAAELLLISFGLIVLQAQASKWLFRGTVTNPMSPIFALLIAVLGMVVSLIFLGMCGDTGAQFLRIASYPGALVLGTAIGKVHRLAFGVLLAISVSGLLAMQFGLI